MQRRMTPKSFTLNDRSLQYIESTAMKEDISQSEVLRRIIGYFIDLEIKEKKDDKRT